MRKLVDDYYEDVKYCMDTDDKNVREERYNAVVEKMIEKFGEEYPEITEQLEEITYKIQKKVVKEWLLQGKRVDGRAMNEIRPLAAEVGVLPKGTRFRSLHKRPDTGSLHCNAHHSLRSPEAGYHI